MKTWTATATAEAHPAAVLDGSHVHASVSVRPNRGLAGRLLAEATTALLNAGALETTLNRLAREARKSALRADLPAT